MIDVHPVSHPLLRDDPVLVGDDGHWLLLALVHLNGASGCFFSEVQASIDRQSLAFRQMLLIWRRCCLCFLFLLRASFLLAGRESLGFRHNSICFLGTAGLPQNATLSLPWVSFSFHTSTSVSGVRLSALSCNLLSPPWATCHLLLLHLYGPLASTVLLSSLLSTSCFTTAILRYRAVLCNERRTLMPPILNPLCSSLPWLDPPLPCCWARTSARAGSNLESKQVESRHLNPQGRLARHLGRPDARASYSLKFHDPWNLPHLCRPQHFNFCVGALWPPPSGLVGSNVAKNSLDRRKHKNWSKGQDDSS